MKRLLLAACWIFAVGLTLHTLFVSDGWTLRGKVRSDLDGLRNENIAAQERIDSLSRELTALRTRPEAQEQTIRSELGLVRPSDVVIDLSEH